MAAVTPLLLRDERLWGSSSTLGLSSSSASVVAAFLKDGETLRFDLLVPEPMEKRAQQAAR